MPRYFLNLNENGDRTIDFEGLELPNVKSAMTAAIQAARAIMAHELYDGTLTLRNSVEITDAWGKILLDVPFSSAVQLNT